MEVPKLLYVVERERQGWLRGPDLNRRPLGYEMLNGQFANALILHLVSRFIQLNQEFKAFY